VKRQKIGLLQRSLSSSFKDTVHPPEGKKRQEIGRHRRMAGIYGIVFIVCYPVVTFVCHLSVGKREENAYGIELLKEIALLHKSLC